MQYGRERVSGSSSCIGSLLGSPYTDALDANTMRFTPWSAAAANTLCVPTMLMSIDSYGSATLLLIETAAEVDDVVAALHGAVDGAAVANVLVDEIDSTGLDQLVRPRSRSPRTMLSKMRTF